MRDPRIDCYAPAGDLSLLPNARCHRRNKQGHAQVVQESVTAECEKRLWAMAFKLLHSVTVADPPTKSHVPDLNYQATYVYRRIGWPQVVY
jgi:hypothetical protein